MKKKFMKAASFMLSALLAVTPVCAFADEEVVEETTVVEEVTIAEDATLYDVEHSIEAYRAVGNKTVFPGSGSAGYLAYYVTPSGATTKTNTQSTILTSKQNLVVAKFPIPKAEHGKQLGRYIIQFIAQNTSGSAISVLKLEGTDYDFSTLNSQDARIQQILSDRASYVATDHPVIGEAHESLGSIYRNFADVTTYAKECEAKGQEYFYLIVGCTSSTRNMMFNVTWSEYVNNDTYHACYYNFEDMGELSLISTTPENGKNYPACDDGALFVFSNPIETATATVNGSPASCEIDARKVTVGDLVEGEENTVELTVTDIIGNTLTETITFMAGYDSAKLTLNTYTVNSSGSSAGTYNPSVHSGMNVILRIPLPELQARKDFRTFNLEFLTPSDPGTKFYLRKLPGDDWDVTKLIRAEGTAPDGKMNIYPYVTDAAYKANEGDIIVETVDIPSSSGKPTSYLNTADLTAYAQECLANGQKTMWVAVGSSSTLAFTGIGDSSHAANNRWHYVTWSTKSATSAKFVSATIESGDDSVAADTELSFEYSAAIKSAKATLNGNDVDVTLKGKNVIVDAIFAECTDYIFEMTAVDVYGFSTAKTIRFSTALKAGETIPENPVIDTYDVTYRVDEDANELTELSFVFLTQIDDINSAIEIKDSEGNVLESEFEYDADTNKYNITSPVALEADKAYTAVIKAGTTDAFFQEITEDVVIAKFYCGETPEDQVVNSDEYINVEMDSANSIVDVVFQNIMCSNSEVDIQIVFDDDIIYEETVNSGKRGLITLNDVSLSESGMYIIKFIPKNSPVVYSCTIPYYTQEFIEEYWGIVAIDGSATQISDGWQHIAYLFGLANEYTPEIKDFDSLGEKIVAARGKGFGEMNEDNIAALKELTDELTFYAAVEQMTSHTKIKAIADMAKAYVETDETISANEELKNELLALLALWDEAMDSEHATLVLRTFSSSEGKVNSLDDILTEIDSALDAYRRERLLEAIPGFEHVSEVETVVSDANNARILGVTDLMKRYNNLKDTTPVNKAMRKAFDSAEAFAKAFEKAIKDAEDAEEKAEKENNKKGSSSSSGSSNKGFGGGDTNFNIVSSVPVEQTPFNPFADVEDIAWAKDHVIKLYNTGIINGKTSTSFAPYDNITREEFVKLIVAMTNLTDDGAAAGFDDVPSDSWFAPYVNAAVANGIVKGVGGNNFGTGLNATRQDIAVMIVNALNKKGVVITKETANFKDAGEIADYAFDAVSFLNAKGVVSGDGSGSFNPTAKATRAEVAVMLSRVADIFSKELK